MIDQNLAKQSILAAALKIVPFEGWQAKTLEEASLAAGFDARYGHILFPEGVAGLVGFFVTESDRIMLERLKNTPLTTMRVRDRIALAVKIRIEQHEAYKAAIPATLRFFAMPQHSLQGMRATAHTASEIWYAAGDNATDFNYYSKRFLLAGVYSSTLLFWLDDTSENHEETWKFLGRRIDNVMQIGKLKQKILNYAKAHVSTEI